MKKADPARALTQPEVSYRLACELLEVKARQLRNLIAQGKLDRRGQGHIKKVSSRSVARYGGFTLPSDGDCQKFGNKRQQAAMGGDRRQSTI